MFHPEFSIPVKRFFKSFPTNSTIEQPLFRNILWHIGMIELISYWKAACPARVVIRGNQLTEEQVKWWKHVYFQGLGEFFYTNQIQTSFDDFMQVSSDGEVIPAQSIDLDNSVIVPIGGGKDSVVTLELLRNEMTVRPFIMNPRGATVECAQVAGFGREEFIEVNRRIDPLLLSLNAEGYLNVQGTAMTAYGLPLNSVKVQLLFQGEKTNLTNLDIWSGSSANEPTVAGTDVNHQYSKSYSFEADFRDYVREYISGDFNYFSFLRPLNELQIARIFAENTQYYPVFKSCNAGSKTDIWCCNCPKCLFAFTILSPFIAMDTLVAIFGENLFGKPDMLNYLRELTGLADVKPFECVGTVDEVNAALHLYIENHKNEQHPLLIDYYIASPLFSANNSMMQEKILNEFNGKHFLKREFLDILKQKKK